MDSPWGPRPAGLMRNRILTSRGRNYRCIFRPGGVYYVCNNRRKEVMCMVKPVTTGGDLDDLIFGDSEESPSEK